MTEQLAKIGERVTGVSSHLDNEIKRLYDLIYPKCDTTEVKLIETKVLDKLNDIVENLYKKFADKSDMKHNLKILERQIKNMFELMMN